MFRLVYNQCCPAMITLTHLTFSIISISRVIHGSGDFLLYNRIESLKRKKLIRKDLYFHIFLSEICFVAQLSAMHGMQCFY